MNTQPLNSRTNSLINIHRAIFCSENGALNLICLPTFAAHHILIAVVVICPYLLAAPILYSMLGSLRRSPETSKWAFRRLTLQCSSLSGIFPFSIRVMTVFFSMSHMSDIVVSPLTTAFRFSSSLTVMERRFLTLYSLPFEYTQFFVMLPPC